MITIELFKKCFPENKTPELWVSALNKILPKYEINTRMRLSAFLAQCGHESGSFTQVIENLNYSAKALTTTWPKRFPTGIAEQYARQPEKIGNRAYADRMGNGAEASGDGFKFRGRGCIQLTGKDSYKAFGASLGLSLEEVIPYLETKEGAVESACFFWKNNNLNAIADTGNVLTMTKRINGGINGLEDRNNRYTKIIVLLKDVK